MGNVERDHFQLGWKRNLQGRRTTKKEEVDTDKYSTGRKALKTLLKSVFDKIVNESSGGTTKGSSTAEAPDISSLVDGD